jgi:hypothetical protein
VVNEGQNLLVTKPTHGLFMFVGGGGGEKVVCYLDDKLFLGSAQSHYLQVEFSYSCNFIF